MFRYFICVVVSLFFATSAYAQVFTCRDADGKFYAGDNLQALPESCRAQVKKLPDEPSGNLNYVPEANAGSPNGQDFNRQVRQATQEISVRKNKEQDLVDRARSVAAQYRDAEKQKWAARKDLTSRSRGTYEEAQKKQQALLKEKDHILNEVGRGRYSSSSREIIEKELKSIGSD